MLRDRVATFATFASLAIVAVSGENALAQPVAFSLAFSNPNFFSDVYTVPANKRLIIEFASGHCNVLDARLANLVIIANLSGNTEQYTVNLSEVNSTNTDVPANGVFSHLVKIYAEAGTQINFATQQAAVISDGYFNCQATLSGLLVDVPLITPF